ncbi:hypothetical protein [Inhella sp.]|uniref:hypothetical protein n=1 Tax=Inhella sp. TaxID=1921806 RepID=UPI0035AF357B
MKTKPFSVKAASLALFALIAVTATAADSRLDSRSVMSSVAVSEELIKNKGLIRWTPHPDDPKNNFYIQVPQLKLFDAGGHLVFHGSALEALEWQSKGSKLQFPPAEIKVREWKAEAQVLGLTAGLSGPRAVFYVSEPCPPCVTQLARLRTEVLPRFGADSGLTVVRVGGNAAEKR